MDNSNSNSNSTNNDYYNNTVQDNYTGEPEPSSGVGKWNEGLPSWLGMVVECIVYVSIAAGLYYACVCQDRRRRQRARENADQSLRILLASDPNRQHHVFYPIANDTSIFLDPVARAKDIEKALIVASVKEMSLYEQKGRLENICKSKKKEEEPAGEGGAIALKGELKQVPALSTEGDGGEASEIIHNDTEETSSLTIPLGGEDGSQCEPSSNQDSNAEPNSELNRDAPQSSVYSIPTWLIEPPIIMQQEPQQERQLQFDDYDAEGDNTKGGREDATLHSTPSRQSEQVCYLIILPGDEGLDKRRSKLPQTQCLDEAHQHEVLRSGPDLKPQESPSDESGSCASADGLERDNKGDGDGIGGGADIVNDNSENANDSEHSSQSNALNAPRASSKDTEEDDEIIAMEYGNDEEFKDIDIGNDDGAVLSEDAVSDSGEDDAEHVNPGYQSTGGILVLPINDEETVSEKNTEGTASFTIQILGDIIRPHDDHEHSHPCTSGHSTLPTSSKWIGGGDGATKIDSSRSTKCGTDRPCQYRRAVDSSCSICLLDYVDGDRVAWNSNAHKCNHAFHVDCLIPWLMRRDDCPNCRSSYFVASDGDENGIAGNSATSRSTTNSSGTSLEEEAAAHEWWANNVR